MAVQAQLLRLRRDELDLSNEDVGRLTKISPRYAENIMQGRDQPSRRVIFRLARTLKMPAEDIDPDITHDKAGKRTPQGDPSEPPRQPPNEPRRPPGRKDNEGDRDRPPRAAEAVV